MNQINMNEWEQATCKNKKTGGKKEEKDSCEEERKMIIVKEAGKMF